ncbi:MAG TPA: carboxypeptidase-like regulatory domain-containing protein [Streptosporangiaceae bacterium]
MYKRFLLALLAALSLTVAAGRPALAADAVGTISGHITTSRGDPAASAHVVLFHPSGIASFEKLAQRDGTFQFDNVGAGDYKLSVEYDGVHQFAHRKLTFAEGDTFTVQAGTNTVIDEQMFAPGAIEVKVVDAGDGNPVESACVTLLNGLENCSPQDGVFRFEGLGQRPDYVISARAADGLHMPREIRDVAVELGKTTEITIALDPAAVITTRVLDRASGAPVPFICVAALSKYFGATQDGFCPEITKDPAGESAEDGTVRIGEIPVGRRRLFVVPQDGVHGIQWLGKDGGTGSQYRALNIKVIPGHVSTVGPILLDPPGSLSGTFVDATGGPLETNFVCATAMPVDLGIPVGANCNVTGGSFVIPGLGPYRWPVGFFSDGSTYGTQWPGSAKLDRRSAPTFKVEAGTTTDVGTLKLQKGRRVFGDVLGADGHSWPGTVSVTIVNARTGDVLGSSCCNSSYLISPVTEQNIKIRVFAENHGTFWVKNGATIEDGDTIHISSDEDTDLDIVVPADQ